MRKDYCIRPLNQLLIQLPAGDWSSMRPHFKTVELQQGDLLHEAGELIVYVYFPVSAVVSLVSSLSNGGTAQAAVIGPEGVVGAGAALGGRMAYSNAFVNQSGQAARISAAALADSALASPGLRAWLTAFTQALMAQIIQTVACNRHHHVDQQLCRWILLNDERSSSSLIEITHERIAGLLGVRREGVTQAAIQLRQAGVIEYERGSLRILDRSALEARSCECYLTVREAYRQMALTPYRASSLYPANLRRPSCKGAVESAVPPAAWGEVAEFFEPS